LLQGSAPATVSAAHIGRLPEPASHTFTVD